MEFVARTLMPLRGCYSTGVLAHDGQPHYLVSTEQVGPCWEFIGPELEARPVWPGPGGTMCFAPVPGPGAAFLAIQNWFAPYNAKATKLVYGSVGADGTWQIRALTALPFLHRVGVVERNGTTYVVACTLTGGKVDDDDWSQPGAVYAGVLGNDRSALTLTEILPNLRRNHGFNRADINGIPRFVIGSDSGVHLLRPPPHSAGDWEIEHVSATPTGDVAVTDIDADGKPEFLLIQPFHGDAVSIARLVDGHLQQIWRWTNQVEFGHVAWGGLLRGSPAFLFGSRRGAAELVCVTSNSGSDRFDVQVIDQGGGPATIAVHNGSAGDTILCANSATDTAVLYEVR